MIQVGKTVRYFNQATLEYEGDFGKVIGVRMLNAEDTKDLLCTVEWPDCVSDAFDFELEVVENIDNPNQTS